MHGRNFPARCLQVNQHGAILGMQMHRNRALTTPSLGESFINDSGASRGEVADVCLAVIASAAKQSILPRKERMDCFASLAMTAVALWIASRSLSSGAHSRDPLARNDGPIGMTEADGTTVPLTLS
ncbi:MAG TPA: hypothetical protein VEN78_02975 [Bradyrhizobium sp.]|nr:hypothetical protein [Bradyrhizobium sp.]